MTEGSYVIIEKIEKNGGLKEEMEDSGTWQRT